MRCYSLVLKQGLPGWRGRVPLRCRECRPDRSWLPFKVLGEGKQDTRGGGRTLLPFHTNGVRGGCVLLKDRNVHQLTKQSRASQQGN